MEGEGIILGYVDRRVAYEIVSANLKRLCLFVTQLSNTDLCIFMVFVKDTSIFRVTMAQVMEDVFSTSVVA